YTRIASTMPEDVLPTGTPVPGIEQFFLLAASVGELAANLSREKTGAYSRALMEELEKANADWPPDMTDLNRRLLERFTTLRDAGEADQTPSHFWYRDWKGGEGTFAFHKRQTPVKPGAGVQLTNEQQGRIVSMLCDREDQYGKFVESFDYFIEQFERWPQIYFVRGALSECPGLLIERLKDTHINKYAMTISDNQLDIDYRRIEWPTGRNMADRKQLLIRNLFSHMNPGYNYS